MAIPTICQSPISSANKILQSIIGTITPSRRNTSTIIYAPVRTDKSQLTTNAAEAIPDSAEISMRLVLGASAVSPSCATTRTMPMAIHSSIRKRFIIIESEFDTIAPLVLLPQYPLVTPDASARAKKRYPIVFSIIAFVDDVLIELYSFLVAVSMGKMICLWVFLIFFRRKENIKETIFGVRGNYKDVWVLFYVTFLSAVTRK